jgi:putative flippase GtrA
METPQLIRRWTAFNLVGAGGIAVQLAVLALLVHVFDTHYLISTAVAVEAAVLHNFFWHQRWTWRDRPAPSRGATIARLARFQLLNGGISLAGNLALMAVLTGAFDMDPVVASGIAIATCSLVNFIASESLVFLSSVPVLAMMLVLAAPVPAVAGPGTPTLDAWNAYASAIDARYASAPASGPGFFIQDVAGGAAGWRETVRRGAVSTVRIEAPGAGDGRIHHWSGAVFIPGMTVTTVIGRLLQQAGHESTVYDDVVDSRLLERSGDRVRVFMKLRRTTIITATFNTEHTIDYRRLGPRRGSSRSVATRIAELADAGTAREHERPADDDRGFLWKLNAYWRFEETAGGVVVECESVSLSRGVPMLLRPVAGPIIDRVARESLEKTLQGLKTFLHN